MGLCFISDYEFRCWQFGSYIDSLLKWSSPLEHEILLCNTGRIWVQIQPGLLGPLVSWGYPDGG